MFTQNDQEERQIAFLVCLRVLSHPAWLKLVVNERAKKAIKQMSAGRCRLKVIFHPANARGVDFIMTSIGIPFGAHLQPAGSSL
jgi:hypothetical protein